MLGDILALDQSSQELLAHDLAIRAEGIPNHAVGGAANRDVWTSLPDWEVKVGHVVVVKCEVVDDNESACQPWWVGDVKEIIEEAAGIARYGETFTGTTLLLHERFTGSATRAWSHKQKHVLCYRGTDRNGRQQDSSTRTKSAADKPVETPVSIETILYWGEPDEILTKNMELRQKCLDALHNSDKVSWLNPPKPTRKRKRTQPQSTN
jgi:hypothetical protein